MYPIALEIRGVQITTFGVSMVAGFLIATAITSVRLREYGYGRGLATTLFLYTAAGGISGAKLYYAADVSLRTGNAFWPLALSRGGVTWYGGLAGAAVLEAIGCSFHRLPFVVFLNSVCIGACLGQGIGRLGCFLVGDDYGRLTGLPWGIAFPRGNPPTLEPVHPTQLYEFAWLVLGAAFLWRRRRESPCLVGEYLILTGLGRFIVEVFRTNVGIAGLTEAQWIACAAGLIGSAMWLRCFRMTKVVARLDSGMPDEIVGGRFPSATE
jgi:phosphatidylglycerol:prolipoprotein diacylglycerol transferase